MTLPERDVGQEIKRALRWLIGLTVVLYVALAVLTFQSTASLCALKGDLERRVESSQQFLIDHPNGIPGISAKQIKDGIDNQKRTIRSLRFLLC
jgi:hypothetical protein